MPANEKYLEMIQSVISRMAQNSFSLKGWSVTLVSAVFSLGAKDTNVKIGLVAYIPAVVFWALDGYYLWQERRYRVLYERARLADAADASTFSMNPQPAVEHVQDPFRKFKLRYVAALISRTEAGFYGPLLVAMTLIGLLLRSF